MLWSLFQPPERNRSHYLFQLACISTSSFYSTQASRPSVLSLKKTGHRHSNFSVYSWSSVRRPPMSTRLLCTLCVCPISSCLKLSRGYTRLLNVSLLAWNYQKHITQTDGRLCVCYINFRSSISRVPKADISAASPEWAVFCLICPISQPFQHHFLCYLLHFRSPSRSLRQQRRLQCFQARRGCRRWQR